MKRFIILLLTLVKFSVPSNAGNPSCEAPAVNTAVFGNMPPIADAGPDQTLNCFITALFLNGTGSSQGGFTYAWTTQDGNIVEGGNTITPLVDAAGTYTLTVTDLADGSTASDDVMVIQAQPISIQTIDLQPVTCHSTATGSATVAGVGGSGTYSYAWSNGSLTATAIGLVAGSYTVTITDADGCSASSIVVLTEPAPLAANTSATAQSLAGMNDGTATANPTGGSAPYTYVWNNLQTTQTITSLPPGAHTVTVTDAKGCTFSETTTVNKFSCALTGTATVTQVSCFGGADGSISIQLSNAIEPVTYNLPGSNSAIADSLAAGSYTALVRDSAACSLLFTIDITQPSQVSVAELFHVNANCPTDATGSVTVAVNGGVQPYQYLWSNGSTEASASGLSVGEHTFTLTDAKGCNKTLTTAIIPADAQPPTLAVQDLIVVLNENGSATVTPEQFDAGSYDDCGIVSWTVEPSAFNCSHVGEQTVTITATDANGNSNTALAAVFVEDKIAPNMTCPNSANLSLCDPVLDFQLPTVTDNCAVIPSQLLQTAGLPSGTPFPLGETSQAFSYTDAGGNVATCSFTVTVVNALEVGLLTSDASCNGGCNGNASLSPTNGIAPYNVLWSNDDTGTSVGNLCAGDYFATLTDASGCEIEISVQIAEPNPIEVSIDSIASPACSADSTGFMSVSVSGGVLPYSYQWADLSGNESIDSLVAGTYNLEITDANGCQTSFTKVLTASDNEAPQVLLNNLMVSLDSNGLALLSPQQFDAGSTDNCSIDGWSLTPPFLDCSHLGSQMVTATASDGAGNTTSGVFMVTVVDNIAPTLICPANIFVGNCNATVNFSSPFLTDNCTVNTSALLQTAGLPLGTNFPVGITTQSYRYTDASGNSSTCSFTITVAPQLVVIGTPQNISCPDACDGQVSLNITGGLPPYQVQWSDGQTDITAVGLCPGTISATVTDAQGCIGTYSATVIQPPALSVAIIGGSPDVNGQGVGSISISMSGGTLPYAFAWTKDGDSFSNAQNLTGLNAGTYVVEVTDANGCVINSIEIIIENLTGTDEPAWAKGLRLFPNPATDWTQLSIGNPLPVNCALRMLDQLGRIALSTNISKGEVQRTIDLRALTPGTYTLMLCNEQEVVVRKLIVQ